jgi:hypothetical protein
VRLDIIERCTDAAHINAIVNHPTVLPWVRGAIDGPLDVSPLLNDGWVALFGEHGGVMFQPLQAGLWEAHSQYVPAGRGQWALSASWQALRWMFARTDAIEIVTRCPSLAARALAKALHMTRDYTSARGWLKDGRVIPADIYRMTIQDWMRLAPGLEERGAWFHDRLDAEFARHGAKDELHPDDATHDRYVGAACEMVLGGNPIKGVYAYNRFAAMAGYHPLACLSLEPVTIDIGNAVLRIEAGDFTVESVRCL